MNDLISVIVPVYNIEDKLLDKCINSIINQTYKNLEIIIVDDGSKKETENECIRLSSTDTRIKLIRENNQGSAIARQNGVINSRGKYICFIDHDDYMDECMIEKLYITLVSNNADISVCGIRYIYENGEYENRFFYQDEQTFDKDKAYLELMKDKEMNSFLWNKMFKRKLFDGIIFPAGSLFDDCHVMCRIFYKAEKVVVCPDYLYNYFQFSGSVIHNVNIDRFLDRFCALKDRWTFTCDNMPKYSSIAAETMIKYSVKYLNDYRNYKFCDKNQYLYLTKDVFDILERDDVRAVALSMRKYSDDYIFLMKHKNEGLWKMLYMIKKRIIRKWKGL